MKRQSSWLSLRRPLPPRRAAAAKFAAFGLPLAIWCLVSYVPFIWHPDVLITDPGGSDYQAGSRLSRQAFDGLNARLADGGEPAAAGEPINPIYLPAPHQVVRALYTALTSAPPLKDAPWMHQRLWHSCKIIFWGFVYSAVIGVPLGVLCGVFDLFSKLFEPFIDFIRYMPAPAFAGLCVAMFGIADAPKIAVIWIGTFFQMVLVVANTTRQFDPALLEAAQTLGASRWSLLTRVVVPGILPNLYNDMRILIGWAWTYLIVGELEGGTSSGISEFLKQQSKNLRYDNVFAGIVLIGLIGLVVDQVLGYLAKFLFPWQPAAEGGGLLGALGRAASHLRRRVLAGANRSAPAATDVHG